MKKRAWAVIMLLIFMFSATGVRMAFLARSTAQVGGVSSNISIDIKTLRGTVYDCNMEPLTNGETELYAVAKPSGYSLGQLKGKVLPDVFDSILERMSKGKPIVVKIGSSIVGNNDIKEIEVAVRYPSESLACHIIGYLDGSGHGVSGVEKAFDSQLSENQSYVRARFATDANGRVMLGENIVVENSGIPKSGVVLTIDKKIQKITENALDKLGAKCASAVVIEIESGAIRACVSRPFFDSGNISASLADENSPLINRAFLPFSVGSVFKPVVAAAALECGISEDFQYNCTGSVMHNGVTFNCHKKDGHGVVNMEKAVAYSCNTYFIALAIKTGAENIINAGSEFGFGKSIEFCNGITSSSGNFPTADSLDSKAAIANLSFGQGALSATPLQICNVMATLARNGVYVDPYLIEGETDSNGEFTEKRFYAERKQIISYETARTIRGFLENVVIYGSGKRAESKCVTSAGKTATAQTGKTENGEEIYNAWFAGYFPADNPRYAVAILRENGGEGALSCAPIFKEIAEMCCDYG